jgi:hypothetical protein
MHHHGATMKEYITAIAAVIAGIFAVVAAFITWKLKNSSENRRDQIVQLKEKFEEEKSLYTTTYQLFEEAINQVLGRGEFNLTQAFSENNAKIHLLASRQVIDQYSEAAALLESWSELHAKASPRQTKFRDETVTIIQSPDPTAKYKEPAKAEYKKLQASLRELVALMRNQLANNA